MHAVNVKPIETITEINLLNVEFFCDHKQSTHNYFEICDVTVTTMLWQQF